VAGLGPGAQRIVKRAKAAAASANEDVSAIHIAIELVRDPRGPHSAILRRLAINRSTIAGEISRTTGVGPLEVLPDPAPKPDTVSLPVAEARKVITALARATTTHPETFLDGAGLARWWYGAVRGDADRTRIAAEPVVRLRDVVRQTLARDAEN
jgi:hypothetical protein